MPRKVRQEATVQEVKPDVKPDATPKVKPDDIEAVKPKPKRMCSEKQLAALAAGRSKNQRFKPKVVQPTAL